MYKDLKVDDNCLRGKLVIGKKDVINLLPEIIKENVEAACVYVDLGQPRWVIFLTNDQGGYQYQPFSHEMIYDPYVRQVDWGRIYLWRKARYERTKEGKHTYFDVYVCRPHHMFLLREVKRTEMVDTWGVGFVTSCKWFRAFP